MSWNYESTVWHYTCNNCGRDIYMHCEDEEPDFECACSIKPDAKEVVQVRDELINEMYYAFNVGIVLMDNPEWIDTIKEFTEECKKKRIKE